MALIKCPECGKEVSDKAQACIHCGYPLSNDIKKVHNTIEAKPSTKENEKIINSLDKEILYSPSEEKNPGCLITLMICVVIIVIASIFCIKVYDGISAVFTILIFAFSILFIGYSIHTWLTTDPKEIKENWDNDKYNNYMFTCPMCGSKKVKKIGTINRAASIATVGLASSKIGKQYECDNCQHKW